MIFNVGLYYFILALVNAQPIPRYYADDEADGRSAPAAGEGRVDGGYHDGGNRYEGYGDADSNQRQLNEEYPQQQRYSDRDDAHENPSRFTDANDGQDDRGGGYDSDYRNNYYDGDRQDQLPHRNNDYRDSYGNQDAREYYDADRGGDNDGRQSYDQNGRNEYTADSNGGQQPESYGSQQPVSYGGQQPESYGSQQPESYDSQQPESYGSQQPDGNSRQYVTEDAGQAQYY